jgi:Holliday junction resolvase-like predicted endonuclease
MSHITDTDAFERGAVGEAIVAEFLKQQGLGVVPVHQCNPDGAAVMRLQDDFFVLPDWLVFSSTEPVWVEVKTKQSAREFRKENELRHCINEYHYDQYLEVERLSGFDVWLFIYEEDSGKILRAPLNWLLPAQFLRASQSSGAFQSDVVFFRRNEFIDAGVRVDEFDEIRSCSTVDRFRTSPPNDPFSE